MVDMLGPYPLNSIVTGDARELSKEIPDESVDLIFTDPPYPRKFLYLYEWLAGEAARLLKLDGFLLTYAGEYHKNKILRMLDDKLQYFWDLAAVNYQGPGPMIWQRRIISKYKSVLAYCCPGQSPKPRCNVLSVFNGSEYDKRYHAWQQDAATARYYIDCFSKQGDIIFDPFCGGGTTPAMCKVIDRKFISFEIIPEQANIARARVASQKVPELPAFQQDMVMPW